MPRSLIVEADGAARGNPGPASYGALVRDAQTGAVLAERSATLGTTTNNVAEYSGLIAGLEAVFALDPAARVEVRMDSKLVIEQMAGRWAIKHPNLRPLALAARARIPAGAQIAWTWIPRAQNSAADRLANLALDGGRPAARAARTSKTSTVRPKIIGWAGDLGSVTTLLMLRHGETPHTAGRCFSGKHTDPALSAIGAEQAAAAAARLAGRGGIDAVISSPLRRARQTAQTAADALGLEVEVFDAISECDFGDWDGLTFAEVLAGWGEELTAWLGDPAVRAPGGESLQEVASRVEAAQQAILQRWSGRSVLIVAHVTPIKLLIRSALDASMDLIHRLQLAPASLSTVCWYGDGNSALHAFNDIAHLGSLDRGDGA